MRKSFVIICIILLTGFIPSGYSQRLTAGYISGINFSDIHADSYSGKWKYKPGPVQGIALNYNFLKVIGFRAGLSYSTINYEYKNYYPYYGGIYMLPYPWSSSMVLLPEYRYLRKMDFSFLSIPAQLNVVIPSRPQVNLAAGVFYSFLLDHSMNYEYETGIPKNDFGYLYSAGISYPFTDNIQISLDLRYMTGRKDFYDSGSLIYSSSSLIHSPFRHGTFDFIFGIAYSGFFRDHHSTARYLQSDTINENIFIAYRGGVNISMNSCEYFRGKYSLFYGPSAGLALYLRLSEGAYFQTGVSFERTGYSLRDSSDFYYRYEVDEVASHYVRTRVSADYIMIPVMLHFQAGRQRNLYLNTGPYLSIKLNARCKGEAFSESESQGYYSLTRIVVYDDIEGLLKDNDIGWIFGGGMTFPFSKYCSLDFGLQYRIGLKDVFNKTGYSQSVADKSIIRNSVVSINAGLRVPVYRLRK